MTTVYSCRIFVETKSKMEIKTQRDKIKQILILHPETRNSDLKLLKRLWFKESLEHGAGSTVHFLELLEQGKFTNPESIRRCRQKLQQHCPELRGSNQAEKHAEQEPVKKDLKTFFKDEH